MQDLHIKVFLILAHIILFNFFYKHKLNIPEIII